MPAPRLNRFAGFDGEVQGTRAILGLVLGLALVVLLAAVSPPALAASGWRQAGFGGAGNFLALTFDPRRPGVLYVTSDVAGVYRSEDSGDSWEPRSKGLGNYEVSSFAVDPFDSDRLYAGVGAFAASDKAGIYISRDAGRSWAQLPASAANGITFRLYRTPRAIAPDPSQPGVILSGSRDNGIWRTSDGGETWTRVLEAPLTDARLSKPNAGSIVDDPEERPYRAPVSAVVFDPREPSVVFAAFYGVGVFRSTAGGAAGSWQLSSQGLPAAPTLRDLAIGPGGVLYAAAGEAGVFKSVDGGRNWQAANGALPLADIEVFSVAVHPDQPEVAYLSQAPVSDPSDYYAAVWKTEDGGRSWAETGAISFDLENNPTERWRYYPAESWNVAIDPNAPERVFFTEAWSIERSEDAGASWRAVVRGAQNSCVTDFAIDAVNDETGAYRLYATQMDAGLLASDDKGESWRAVLPNHRNQYDALAGHFWRVLVQGNGDQRRLLTTLAPWHYKRGEVMASDDGRTWRTIFSRPVPDQDRGPGRLYLAADPRRADDLYLVQDGGQVFRSRDAGETWVPTGGQPDVLRYNDLVVDEQGRLFAAGFWNGLWRSDDGGETWERVLPDRKNVWDLAVDQSAIYAAADDGNLHRSRDGGLTWEALSDFPPGLDSDGTGIQAMAVAVRPGDPRHIVFSRVDHWHSLDGGDTLWESRDGGESWARIDDASGPLRVQTLALAPDGTIFAGSWCAGIWRHET